jgi:hypothetical protein
MASTLWKTSEVCEKLGWSTGYFSVLMKRHKIKPTKVQPMGRNSIYLWSEKKVQELKKIARQRKTMKEE